MLLFHHIVTTMRPLYNVEAEVTKKSNEAKIISIPFTTWG